MIFRKDRFFLYKLYIGIIACCLLFGSLVNPGCGDKIEDENAPDSFYRIFSAGVDTITVDDCQKFYAAVKETELSEHSEALLEIIEKRMRCYSEEESLKRRLSECKKEYQLDIINYVKEKINSSPDFGKFIHCVETCPAVSAICKGERTEDCSELEVQCIEFCLDKFWRGFMTYHYKK